MIFRTPDSTGINPVGRIMPVLAVAAIGDAAQELDFRAVQFTRGQEYFARVMSRVDDTSFNVKVDGALLKMNLGNAAQVGQTLVLKYIQDSPVPTFLLSQNATSSESTLSLSVGANLLGKYLQQAELAGVPSRFEATSIVSMTPQNPQVLAQDLRHAISSSGLFYESHLGDMVKGQRSISATMQEPQNQTQSINQATSQNQAMSQAVNQSMPQANASVPLLLAQQLNILENQRMSWHGEVWPGQHMDWDVSRQQDSSRQQAPLFSDAQSDEQPLVSELTLHMPNLGKVTAKLHFADGRLRINILAHEPQAVNTLRQQSPALVNAMEKNGQVLDGLTVARDD